MRILARGPVCPAGELAGHALPWATAARKPASPIPLHIPRSTARGLRPSVCGPWRKPNLRVPRYPWRPWPLAHYNPAMPRLHVNVDHVATVRQARREAFPDPVAWALAAEAAGALGITCHLRRDRRHIQDDDVRRLRAEIGTLLNLELSLAPEIVEFALGSGADAFCLVPENRAEVTTEGGLDVVGEMERLRDVVSPLKERGGLVSLFVDPDHRQLEACAEAGAQFVELHTGAYANARGPGDGALQATELERLTSAAERAHALGLGVNAGHGLDLRNVAPVARLPHLQELNIGFAIVAESLTVGVTGAVEDMLNAITDARTPGASR